MHYILQYVNGDWDIVFAPSITQSRRIIVLARLFKEAIAKDNLWWMPEVDEILFDKYRPYYNKIGEALDITPSLLKPESRHSFFVTSKLLEYEGQPLPELSELEVLLGFRPFEKAIAEDTEEPEKDIISTGDPFLDVIAQALYLFKVPNLENHYSLDDLAKMCKQINDLLKKAEDEAKEGTEAGDENLESEETDEDFVRDRARISRRLKELGVEIPLGL